MAIIKENVIKKIKFLNENNNVLNIENIGSLSFKDIKNLNNKDHIKTLTQLNNMLLELQGSDDKNNRKLYFKILKLYEKLTKLTNQSKDTWESIFKKEL